MPGTGYTVREMVIARDTPPGWGRPVCVACGKPVTDQVVHVHHRLYKSRGGDGRPANGIVVHGDGQAGSCHRAKIHDQGTVAASSGLAISRHQADPYATPLLCPWRGLILLDNEGSWRLADEALWASTSRSKSVIISAGGLSLNPTPDAQAKTGSSG
jgi:hypothetical protein